MQGLTRLAALSTTERARVLARLRGEERDAPRRRPAGEPAVASFLQEQLWFLDRLVGGEPVYNVPFSFRLRGRLDTAALLDAIQEVIARHDVLRTRLLVEGGRLVQAPGPVPRPSVFEASDAGAARCRVDDLARTRFDLDAGPPLRVELLRLGDDDHRLVWVAHHVAIDGWSVGLLVDELRALYLGRPLPRPGVQYADFACWQRDRLSGAGLDALLDHWRGRLSGAGFPGLPADQPRPAVQTFTGGIERFQLGAGLVSSLREMAGRHRATLFAALLAAYQALAASWAGTTDAVVGVPIAGRPTAQLQSLVGPLSNTVPIRVDVSGDPSFRAVLARVSDALLDAAAHHEVPLGRLVAALGAGGDISRNPLFGLVFNMDTLPIGTGDQFAPGVAVTAGGHPNGTVRMDLELTFEQSPRGGLDGRLEYNVDLYRPATVRRFAVALRSVLGAVSAEPGRRLSTIGALSAARHGSRPTPASAGLVSDWLAGPT